MGKYRPPLFSRRVHHSSILVNLNCNALLLTYTPATDDGATVQHLQTRLFHERHEVDPYQSSHTTQHALSVLNDTTVGQPSRSIKYFNLKSQLYRDLSKEHEQDSQNL